MKLRPVHPNLGIELAYRRKIRAIIDEMHKSVAHWLMAAYRANPPRIAQDATPAAELAKAMRGLSRQWQRNFDEAAPALAEYFAKSASKRSDAALRSILKKGGYSVKFRMTPAANDIIQATVAENVALIKSIPGQYLTQVEGMVMRSVQTGRDLATLSKEIQAAYGVTRKRAELIARDQNNKATSAIQRARQIELGINEAIWMHSGAGKEPRPTHVKMDGKRYDVTKGMYDSAEQKWIFPGELINCRCVSRPVIQGFS